MAYLEKMRCRGCDKMYPPSELVTRLCGHCWDDKLKAMGDSVKELSSFSDGEVYRCMECSKRLGPGSSGHLVWVKDAGRFALFCLDCSDKKFSTDSQYRGTPFAYAQKIS